MLHFSRQYNGTSSCPKHWQSQWHTISTPFVSATAGCATGFASASSHGCSVARYFWQTVNYRHDLSTYHAPVLPTTQRNVTLPKALAKPVAHNLSPFHQCHRPQVCHWLRQCFFSLVLGRWVPLANRESLARSFHVPCCSSPDNTTERHPAQSTGKASGTQSQPVRQCHPPGVFALGD